MGETLANELHQEPPTDSTEPVECEISEAILRIHVAVDKDNGSQA